MKELEKTCVKKENVTILSGVEADSAMNYEEKTAKYGKWVVDNYKVINHNASDQENLTDMGTTPEGVPRIVNTLLTKMDKILAIGVTDLHQYAGFSGGAKTIAVGCASEKTISYTHSASFLEKSGAVPGRIKGNLFQDALWEIVKPLPFIFCVNIILNAQAQVLALDAGHPKMVFEKMMTQSRKIFLFDVAEPFDIAYLGVPHPKDVNLYQASRAATYQALSDRPVFRHGAVLNLICESPEGFGEGAGEERFREKMMELPDPEAVVREMTGKTNLPGEQRAYMVAKTMIKNPINIWGPEIDAVDLNRAGFLAQPLVPEEIRNKKLRALVMKDGMKKVLKMNE